MDNEILILLMQKLSKKQLSSILKRSEANNKKFRIDGFANIEKAPLEFLASQLKNSAIMAQEFLKFTVMEFLPDPHFADDNTVDAIKVKISDDNKLGIVAHCLLQSDEDFSVLAKEILNGCVTPVLQEEIIPPALSPVVLEREKKKTEKYKQKYQDAKKERDIFKQRSTDVKQIIDDRDHTILELQNRILELDSKISEQSLLLGDQKKLIEEQKEEIKACSKETQKKCDTSKYKQQTNSSVANILALGCYDALAQYYDVINIDYTEPLATENFELFINRYDEIWVVSSSVSFGIHRKLKRCSALLKEKIHFFACFQELLEHADEMCN